MNSKHTRKGITALFAAVMIVSVLAVMPSVQAADDYFIYAKYYPTGQSGLGACGGYVDADGNEYIYYWTGSPAGMAYKVQVETDGDPNMHPDNPNATGPMANRTFTEVSNHSCIADMGVSFYLRCR